MSTEQPTPTEPTTTGSARTSDDAPVRDRHQDPLRRSRAGGAWVALLLLAIVLVLLAIFILQNTQKAQVSFLGWSGQAPLSATLLIAAAGGALVVAAAGAMRILQLRRRVKRELKSR